VTAHPSKSRAAMCDGADGAGVRLKTVSRVVNAEPGVTERTLARVLSAIGETEAWVILGTPQVWPSHVCLGFQRHVPEELLRTWTAKQDRSALLCSTNHVTLSPGDAVLVPARLPHAIDPVSFSSSCSSRPTSACCWGGRGSPPDGLDSGHLRLGLDLALECVDRRAWSPEAVAGLIRHPARMRPVRPGVRRVVPEAADPYLRAEHIRRE
jgi:mannose-6-phosphate isomerase